MPLKFYFDQHVKKAIATGLRLLDIDVLTAYEDNASTLDDPELLDRATELERLLFTQDDDLLVEAAKRQQDNISFSGIVYGHQLRVTVGQCVEDLELISTLVEPEEVKNQVIFLPL